MVEVKMTNPVDLFNEIEQLRGEEGADMARVFATRRHIQLYCAGDWLPVKEARALRDWLNKALPPEPEKQP